MTPTTEEDIKMVAVFMGYKVKRVDDTSINNAPSYYLFIKNGITTPDYYPDRDWNELMPVVERIESLKAKSGTNYEVSIQGNACHIYDPEYFMKGHEYYHLTIVARSGVDGKRETVWLAVVDFLKWYNNQN